jgi:hypothetical protein
MFDKQTTKWFIGAVLTANVSEEEDGCVSVIVGV